MDRFNDSADSQSLASIRHIAVAIKQTKEGQRHLGLLHADSGCDETKCLHLAWHCDLRNEKPRDSYAWVDPRLHKLRLRQLAAKCRLVWEANSRDSISYGFGTPNDCFDAETGESLLGPTKLGLTCATFVLAVFHLAGINLVDVSSWPKDDPDDVAWQDEIVETLRKHGAEDTHVDAVEKQIGAVRIRPEHVAASASKASHAPLSLTDVQYLSSEIVDRLSTN